MVAPDIASVRVYALGVEVAEACASASERGVSASVVRWVSEWCRVPGDAEPSPESCCVIFVCDFVLRVGWLQEPGAGPGAACAADTGGFDVVIGVK